MVFANLQEVQKWIQRVFPLSKFKGIACCFFRLWWLPRQTRGRYRRRSSIVLAQVRDWFQVLIRQIPWLFRRTQSQFWTYDYWHARTGLAEPAVGICYSKQYWSWNSESVWEKMEGSRRLHRVVKLCSVSEWIWTSVDEFTVRLWSWDSCNRCRRSCCEYSQRNIGVSWDLIKIWAIKKQLD